MSLSKIYNKGVLDYPKVMIIILAVILLFFSFFINDFKLDASADSLVLENDTCLETFRDIHERYKIKKYLIITFTPDKDIFSQDSLSCINNLSNDILKINEIDSVISILDIPLLKTSNLKISDIKTENIKTLKTSNINYERAKTEILNSPLYKDLILSRDGKTTALQVNLKINLKFRNLLKERALLIDKSKKENISEYEQEKLIKLNREYEDYYSQVSKKRHLIIKNIRSVIKKYNQFGEIYLGGVPMIADDMLTFVRKDLIFFGIGVFAFIVIILFVIFSKIKWVILPLISCFFSVFLMIGILGFLSWKVTVISSNFISLMLILTISMNIHLIVRYKQLCNKYPSKNQKEIVGLTINKMFMPCLYTAFTTILAFSSLVFSGIKPVMDFGWMMTIGLLVAFVISFILFPSILTLMKKIPTHLQENKESKITNFLATISLSHGRYVLLFSLLLAILSVWGLSELKVENSFINYFKKTTEIHKGMLLIDQKLGGTTPLEIIINFDTDTIKTNDLRIETKKEPHNKISSSESGQNEYDEYADEMEEELDWDEDENTNDYWLTPYKLNKIKTVHDYLSSLNEVGKVLSIASLIRVAEGLNNSKEFDGLELSVLLKKIPDEIKASIIDPYISIDHNEARISLRILDSQNNLRRNELINRIKSDLYSKFSLSEKNVRISGMLILYNNMLQSLFKSQILTLGTVLLGILIMLLILFRSFLLSIIGIIPNILAVGTVLGIMGIANIPLDMMTITIAAITMGIAIDNSIHYIYRFREEFSKNKNYEETLKICHKNIGSAILNTSTTIIFGFSILIVSNFIPTIYFGIFTGLAMLIALLSTLTLLPKLILILKPFK